MGDIKKDKVKRNKIKKSNRVKQSKRSVKKSKRSVKDISPIPKKIHFIWLGDREPTYLKKFMKTFETHAPNYSVRLWNDKDITKANFPQTYPYIQKVKQFQGDKIKEWSEQKTMYKTNKKAYTYSKYAQISDLMRYEIVFREGGYYFDANMFLLKDITKLFQRKEKFIGCNELGPNLKKSPILSNSFFGAIPKSPILKRLLSTSFLDKLDLRTLEVDFVTGPGALRSVIKTNDDYHILPANTFYPYILPWTPDGGDHPLRKSSNPKCSGPIRTKKRSLKMKKNLWLEFPCNQYKGAYGIKVWESGGSWTRPQKWYEQSKSERRSVYAEGGSIQKGGAPLCVPCVAAVASNPVGLMAMGAGACVYGAHKAYKCIKKKKKKKKLTKNKKN